MNLRRTISRLIFFGGAGLAAYGQTPTFTIVSAANWGPIVSPASIAAGFGNNITNQEYSALSQPLPTYLGGSSLSFTDSQKAQQLAPLFMASAGQVNLLIPANAALGPATVSVTTQSGSTLTGVAHVSNVAPGIFTANGNGAGAPAGEAFHYTASGSSTYTYTFLAGGTTYTTNPLSISPATDQFFYELYGTGFRNHSKNPVEATINGIKVPVTYAGVVTGLTGLDQINIGPLPQSLAGTGNGDVKLIVYVDGVPSNAVSVNIQ